MSTLQTPSITTLAQPSEPALNGTVLCSFGMQGMPRGPTMSLQGLLAKPMPTAPAPRGALAGASRATPEMQAEEILYEVEWQCVDAASSQADASMQQAASQGAPGAAATTQGRLLILSGTSQPRQQLFLGSIMPPTATGRSDVQPAGSVAAADMSSTLQLSGADTRVLFGAGQHQAGGSFKPLSCMDVSAAGAVSRLLELVQRCGAGAGAGGRLQMTTMASLPSLPGLAGTPHMQAVSRMASISGASLWALLRVAAMEYPKTSFGGQDVSYVNAGTPTDLLHISDRPDQVSCSWELLHKGAIGGDDDVSAVQLCLTCGWQHASLPCTLHLCKRPTIQQSVQIIDNVIANCKRFAA